MMAPLLHLTHHDLGTLVFNRVPGHPSDSSHILCQQNQDENSKEPSCHLIHVFLEEKLVAKGRIGRVYRGVTLSTRQSRIVVKLVMPQGRVNGKKLYPPGHDRIDILGDLAKEASIYALLRPLQGVVVPFCHGYFQNDVAGCLVLEDCGEDLKFPYRRLDIKERRILFELEHELHQAGVSHGDVARRNFVKGPRGIRLLDFDKAVLHQCPGFVEPSSATEFAAETQDMCPELRKLFIAFGLLPMEVYSTREREAYKSWDGEPWWPQRHSGKCTVALQ